MNNPTLKELDLKKEFIKYTDWLKVTPQDKWDFTVNLFFEWFNSQRKEVLDYIAHDQGWEESRDIYAEKFGLQIKYPKLFKKLKEKL
jgi:hypothetical protein